MILDQAYRDVRRIVDPEREPGFRTPNLAIIRGQVRWAIVETIAMEACRSGRLGKLTAAWVRGSDGPVQPPTPSPP